MCVGGTLGDPNIPSEDTFYKSSVKGMSAGNLTSILQFASTGMSIKITIMPADQYLIVVDESQAPSVRYYLEMSGLKIFTEGKQVHSETVMVMSNPATCEESTIP